MTLLGQFKIGVSGWLWPARTDIGYAAAGAVIQYLGETQPAALKLLTGVQTYTLSDFMTLDAATRRNLELTETIRSVAKTRVASPCFGSYRNTHGQALIRQWVSKPLLDIADHPGPAESLLHYLVERVSFVPNCGQLCVGLVRPGAADQPGDFRSCPTPGTDRARSTFLDSAQNPRLIPANIPLLSMLSFPGCTLHR